MRLGFTSLASGTEELDLAVMGPALALQAELAKCFDAGMV